MLFKEELIHLAIAFDEKYLTPFYALLTSIFLNNKGNTIVIHAIATGISESEKKSIADYAIKNSSHVNFYRIDEAFVGRFVLSSQWTSAVYYRLFFPFLVPDYVKKLLYIDTDTLVINDLRSFEEIDLKSFPVAAVYDNWVKVQPLIGIAKEGNYFNSGVLLINVPKWKEQQISEKAFNYLTHYPDRIKFVDQDALNAVLINNWLKIDNRFNLIYSAIPPDLSRQHFNTYLTDKIIIHFTLERPWHMLCQNRFRFLYYRYLKLSPRKDASVYEDFSFDKINKFIKIRLREFYFDSPGLRTFWRRIKG